MLQGIGLKRGGVKKIMTPEKSRMAGILQSNAWLNAVFMSFAGVSSLAVGVYFLGDSSSRLIPVICIPLGIFWMLCAWFWYQTFTALAELSQAVNDTAHYSRLSFELAQQNAAKPLKDPSSSSAVRYEIKD